MVQTSFERYELLLPSHALQKLRLLKRGSGWIESRSMDLQKKKASEECCAMRLICPLLSETLKQACDVDDSSVELELFSKNPCWTRYDPFVF